MEGNGTNKLTKKRDEVKRLKLFQEVADVCGTRKWIEEIISHFKLTYPQVSGGAVGGGGREDEDCFH
jgi:hypothetical protein